MFKKILVPVDGSPTSLQAVSRAVALAKAFDGTVTAIYAVSYTHLTLPTSDLV